MDDTLRDKIHIRDLGVRCIIGINPEERVNKQEVLLNIVMETDLRPAAASDSIGDTTDYKTIKKELLKILEKSEYNLIEKMAEVVAQHCLKSPRVVRVTVTVDKPGALRFARSVAVEITRERGEQ